ncbi:MAG: ATP-dependent dethiobiotin synthetase BioD 1 [Planctomycetes bacterium ADurb.Bin126]|nr:MAG: ATP-dependent dethiobiotin synthetase BioD 1 [Planctomycetes bacterium ADurb.Bin126]HOD82123.1 dethiobiotin synthase [Phycisphaerae bacterium]HQL72299.1 dethiobiotin synthase [Phycisphaerae bacterium]
MSSSRKPDPLTFDVSAWPALPRLKGLMVVGTDTGVGKTLIAGTIARCLVGRGRRVAVFKPAATGCRCESGDLVSEDAAFLAAAARSSQALAQIAPLRYERATAPNVAAAWAGQPVDLEAMFAAYRRLEGQCDVVIVEGVGGILCPISDDFWVIHLARLLELPVVVVARAGLGTINHTLLTLHAARQAGLHLAGVVVNRYLLDPPAAGLQGAAGAGPSDDAELAMFTNPEQIALRGGLGVLAIVPEDAESSVEKSCIGSETQFAIARVDWEAIAGLGRR